MNRPLRPGELKAVQTTFPVTPTREQLIEAVAVMFLERANEQFRVLHRIEDMELDVLRNTPVANTVFEPIAETIAAMGGPATDMIGSVMDPLGMDKDQAHAFACYCHESKETIDGQTAGNRMRKHGRGELRSHHDDIGYY